MLNLVELLRDCPTGMELDCTVFDNITFDYVNTQQNRVYCKVGKSESVWFTPKGCVNLLPDAKCVIFPKGKTTWEGFVPPCQFKDGDVVISTSNSTHLISCRDKNNGWESCCSIIYGKFDSTKTTHVIPTRLSTEEEKQKLFDAIRDNGYKWNPETKTLDKLPKFKVGDIIKYKNGKNKDGVEEGLILSITDDTYDVAVTNDMGIFIPVTDQDNYELAPNKFDISTLKAFDKVLVRDTKEQVWVADLFSHMVNKPLGEYTFACVGHYPSQCIPYEGNEHLLGTTNDCVDFYKTLKNNN